MSGDTSENRLEPDWLFCQVLGASGEGQLRPRRLISGTEALKLEPVWRAHGQNYRVREEELSGCLPPLHGSRVLAVWSGGVWRAITDEQAANYFAADGVSKRRG